MQLPDIETLSRYRKDGDAVADAVVAQMAAAHPALVLGALLERLFR